MALSSALSCMRAPLQCVFDACPVAKEGAGIWTGLVNLL